MPPEMALSLGKKAKHQANIVRARKDSILSEKERRRQEKSEEIIVIPIPPGFN